MQLAVQSMAGPRAAQALCSTSTPTPRRPSRAGRLAVCAQQQEVFCRDVINDPKGKVVQAEGTSTLVFLGAGGQSQEVEVDKSKYILDAGLEAGLELPFTCRGGICGACVVRVTEGECDQSDIADLSFCISEEEAADGMTLICMARPVSDRVVMETQSDWGYALGVAEWKGPTGHISGKQVEPTMGKKWDTSKWD